MQLTNKRRRERERGKKERIHQLVDSYSKETNLNFGFEKKNKEATN